MKLKNVLVAYTIPKTKEQKSSLSAVERALKKYNIACRLVNRDNLSRSLFRNTDLVVAVGGDGTFLRAAHFIGNQLLLGVNSDAKNKEGFFMKSDKNNFGVKLKKIINNDAEIRKLMRLEAWINGRRIGTLALNEYFIGSRKSYHAAKYTIKVNEKKERHKSSGILVTTPVGSHAWAKSCCSKPLPLNSKKFQFVVREPYEGKVFKNYKLKYRLLGRHQKITIISEMLDGILMADSVGKEFKFKNGSKAMIKLSDDYLNAIWQ